jgi:hypothetical protein
MKKGGRKMSIKKQYLKNKSVCKVVSNVPKEAGNGAMQMHVPGEFNKWDKDSTPMKTLKNGGFTATVNLDADKEYQFRYLADGMNWINDDQADASVRYTYGDCDNSVIKT